MTPTTELIIVLFLLVLAGYAWLLIIAADTNRMWDRIEALERPEGDGWIRVVEEKQ